MTAQLLLGKDLLPAGRDFEYTAGRRDQAERRDLLTLGLQDLLRHTDGMGKIASAVAVLDGDVELPGHWGLLSARYPTLSIAPRRLDVQVAVWPACNIAPASPL